MNTFGRLFKISIFGESHGSSIGVTIDGCPPGLPITSELFMPDLDRRRAGAKGTTARQESDLPHIKSGVFKGHSTGSPITITFENKDTDSSAYDKIRQTPRPGHADMVARHKYHGFSDYRGGGPFSGRLTLALVSAGVIAKQLITPIKLQAKILQIGGSQNHKEQIEEAYKQGDSIGGLVECVAINIPPGLGEPFFDSVESIISHLAFSIPGIKGIEFGSGFKVAAMKGSVCNDEIISLDGTTRTNHAGGINGGITNGNNLYFQVAVKPTSSIAKLQKTINVTDGSKKELSVKGRHDACIALRMPVILEAITAIALADFMFIEQHLGPLWSSI